MYAWQYVYEYRCAGRLEEAIRCPEDGVNRWSWNTWCAYQEADQVLSTLEVLQSLLPTFLKQGNIIPIRDYMWYPKQKILDSLSRFLTPSLQNFTWEQSHMTFLHIFSELSEVSFLRNQEWGRDGCLCKWLIEDTPPDENRLREGERAQEEAR